MVYQFPEHLAIESSFGMFLTTLAKTDIYMAYSVKRKPIKILFKWGLKLLLNKIKNKKKL